MWLKSVILLLAIFENFALLQKTNRHCCMFMYSRQLVFHSRLRNSIHLADATEDFDFSSNELAQLNALVNENKEEWKNLLNEKLNQWYCITTHLHFLYHKI